MQGLPGPGIELVSPALASGSFTTEPSGKPGASVLVVFFCFFVFFQISVDSSTVTFFAAAKLLQSCPTLCDPIDGSPPDSPVPGILQAGTLEWTAISFSNA